MSDEELMNGGKEHCWKTIGVEAPGAPTCPRLKDVIHCKNCDVLHAWAGVLLEAPPPPGYLQEWADALSSENAMGEDSGVESVLVFRVGNERLAFPVASIREVARPSGIHRIPQKSDLLLEGIVNIKGSLLLCFSLKKLLAVEETDEAAAGGEKNLFGARFVILEKEGQAWVFPVDEVLDICRWRADDEQNIPGTVSNATRSYTRSVFRHKDGIVGLLDEDLVVDALKRSLL